MLHIGSEERPDCHCYNFGFFTSSILGTKIELNFVEQTFYKFRIGNPKQQDFFYRQRKFLQVPYWERRTEIFFFYGQKKFLQVPYWELRTTNFFFFLRTEKILTRSILGTKIERTSIEKKIFIKQDVLVLKKTDVLVLTRLF